MSLPNAPNDAIASANAVLDILSKKSDMDRYQILLKLLEIVETDINIVGEPYKIHNLELITEYTGKETTKYMVKNETWRKSVQEVLHLKDINEEKLVGYMDTQIQLKMISHRRKRPQEIVNALRNMDYNAEVIPQNTKKKRFFGMM